MFENGIIYTIRYPTIADELQEAETALLEADDPDFAETKNKPTPSIDEMLMLDALFCMATECTFMPKQDGYVTLGLEYALFDRYDNRTGKQVDW